MGSKVIIVDGVTVGYVKAKDKEIECAYALAKSLYATLERVADVTFYLRLAEYNDDCTFQFNLTNCNGGIEAAPEHFVTNPDAEMFLFNAVAEQPYLAINYDNLRESYAGRVEIDVAMFDDVNAPENNKPVPDPLAESLIGIAIYQYRKLIMKYYPQWKTQYLDAPAVESHKIDQI